MSNQPKKAPCSIALLAHVDAGKTTLSEAMLYLSGSINKLGRVDHQNAFLDTNNLERERGITIFSKQAVLKLKLQYFGHLVRRMDSLEKTLMLGKIEGMRRRGHQFSSVQFSRSVVSDPLRPHESQHVRPPCPSPAPGVHSNSRPSSQ